MDIYYFSEKHYGNTMAWGKAREDVEQIFERNNFRKLNESIISNKNSKKFDYFIKSMKSILKVKKALKKAKGETIFLQYPFMREKIMKKNFIKLMDQNKVILFIHDLTGFRYNDTDRLNEELRILKKASVIIVHNKYMQQKLSKYGITEDRMISLELFDYLLSTAEINNNIHLENGVAFAGNLDKSEFLESWVGLKRSYKINLFGKNTVTTFKGSKVSYLGSFSPEDIATNIIGGFGLVWDGNSIKGAKGDLGEYLKINNPHKLSLYIASGMPVMVWKESAVASFVIKHGIGFAISNLNDIDQIITNITEKEYKKMTGNVMKIRREVLAGAFTNNAIIKAIN